MDRGSQLDEEDEEDEDEAGGGSGRQERKERKRKAADIKSNNPHLAGGEKNPIVFGQHQTSNIDLKKKKQLFFGEITIIHYNPIKKIIYNNL